MTQELQTTTNQMSLTPEDIDTLFKVGVIPEDADRAAVSFFAKACGEMRLSPFKRQIHLVRRKGKYTIQVGIDGYRATAARTGEYGGSEEPIFDEKYTEGQMVLDGKAQPQVAKVTVYRIKHGVRCPDTGVARWASYCPEDDKSAFMWRKFPYLMLAKCAEALALRKAFPDELSGVYVDAEMDQAGCDGIKDVKSLPSTAESKTYTLDREEVQRKKDLDRQGTPAVWQERKTKFINWVKDNHMEPQAWAYGVEAGWILDTETLQEMDIYKAPATADEKRAIAKIIQDTDDISEWPDALARAYVAAHSVKTPDPDWTAPGAPTATMAKASEFIPEDEDQIPGAEMPAKPVMLKGDDKWRQLVVPFGKDKDKTLGALDKKSLWYWVMAWKPEGREFKGKWYEPKETDLAFRKRLDEYKPMLVEQYGFTEPKDKS